MASAKIVFLKCCKALASMVEILNNHEIKRSIFAKFLLIFTIVFNDDLI